MIYDFTERTHFFTKTYLSHFILERVDVSVVWERWVERHILREKTSSSHIFFQEPGSANACTPCKLVRDDLISCVSLARLLFSALHLNLTAWFSSRFPLSGYTPVVLECPDRAAIFTNHNVTACHSTRGH